MSSNYIGEIKVSAIDHDHRDWILCDGRELEVDDFPGLFGVLSNLYGGDGHRTFAIPDLRGRFPVGAGQLKSLDHKYKLGEKGGTSSASHEVEVKLQAHTHTATFQPKVLEPLKIGVNSWTGQALSPIPKDQHISLFPIFPPSTAVNRFKASTGTGVTLAGVSGGEGAGILGGSVTLQPAGTEGSTKLKVGPIDTRQPYLAINFFICFNGTYPILENP